MTVLRSTCLALSTSGLLILAGCGGSSSSDDGAATGSMDLAVTDAPVDDAARVVVQFDGVEMKPSSGERLTFEFDSPRQIDLLALQGNDSEKLLDSEQVPAGKYQWIRLMVTGKDQSLESFIETSDGAQHPLWIPSGFQTGLKLVRGFNVPAGGVTDFTIDFDLRKSVVEPGNSGDPYILQPALRIVDNTQVGTLTGTVDTTTASETSCSPAAYIYSGAGATPDDEGSSNPPLTSALINMDESGAYSFTAGFMDEGEYTVAWTCDAEDDDPVADDSITFEATTDATVTAGETTEVTF